MKFHGKLNAIPLKSAFQKISKDLLTGILKVDTKELGVIKIFFEEGEVANFYSKNFSEINWSKVLLAKGEISKKDYGTIETQDIKDLTGLITSQIIKEDKAAQLLRQTVEEEIFAAFLVVDGEFSFETFDEMPSIFTNISLFKKIKFNTTLLIKEALRRSEGQASNPNINNNEIYDKVAGKEKTIAAKLSPDEKQIYDLIDGAKTVFDILRDPNVKKQSMAPALVKLQELNAIKKSDTKDLLEKAHQLNYTLEYESAAKIYQRLVEEEKSVISHRELLSDTYLKLKKPEKAIVELEIIAKHYSQQKKYNKANEALKKILELDSSKFVIHELIANNYVEMEQIEEAKAEYKSVFDLYINDGLLDKANSVYLKIIKLEPDNLEVMSQMARAYSTAGDRLKAVAIWDKMQEIYINSNLYDEAIEILNKIVRADSANSVAKETLESLVKQRDRKKRNRNIIIALSAIVSIGLLVVFLPSAFRTTFPGSPTFDQELVRCDLLAKWLKKKNINEISIYGVSETLITVLKKDGIKASTSANLNFGMKNGDNSKIPQVKGLVINRDIKDIPMADFQKFLENGGVMYFRGFEYKLSENEALCQSILDYLKKGQICVVLPKFPDVDVRTLTQAQRVKLENIFIDETNFVEFENWRAKLLKDKVTKPK